MKPCVNLLEFVKKLKKGLNSDLPYRNTGTNVEFRETVYELIDKLLKEFKGSDKIKEEDLKDEM